MIETLINALNVLKEKSKTDLVLIVIALSFLVLYTNSKNPNDNPSTNTADQTVATTASSESLIFLSKTDLQKEMDNYATKYIQVLNLESTDPREYMESIESYLHEDFYEAVSENILDIKNKIQYGVEGFKKFTDFQIEIKSVYEDLPKFNTKVCTITYIKEVEGIEEEILFEIPEKTYSYEVTETGIVIYG